MPTDLDEQLAVKAAEPAPDVNTYLDRTSFLPEVLHISPPNVFGEIGWLVDGKIVNHDTNVYLERIGLLAESGKLWELRNRTPASAAAQNRPWRRPRILEIGGGYGGLAYHLRKLIPDARYYLLDIPESLLFSSIYLSTLWQQDDNVLLTPDNLAELHKDSPGFTFVPNYLFERLSAAGLEFDLVINTLSMSGNVGQPGAFLLPGDRRVAGSPWRVFRAKPRQPPPRPGRRQNPDRQAFSIVYSSPARSPVHDAGTGPPVGYALDAALLRLASVRRSAGGVGRAEPVPTAVVSRLGLGKLKRAVKSLLPGSA